jgi:uncharacterized protein YprB with RNaseH-like and TPR domain
VSLKKKLDRLASAGPGSRAKVAATPDEPVMIATEISAPDLDSPLRALPPGERATQLRGVLAALEARQARQAEERARERAARETAATLLSDLRPATPLPALARALPGMPRATPHGEVHAVLERYAADHAHGDVCVAQALDAQSEHLAKLALDTALAGRDVTRMLFLDTETTGLAGGTGTLPFLVGLAWFEEGALVVEQLLLPKLGAEAPILHALAARIAWASLLVSYNGKSFDWPLLRTRFVMNRVPVPPLPPHLDLLHCARRVFKRRLEAVRLVHLEAEVLGFHREGDIDGADIPAAYLGWLRGGDVGPLARVVTHNASDLVALPAVLAALHDRFAALRPDDDPRDHLSLAHVAHRAADPGRARDFARAVAEGGASGELVAEAWSLLARLERDRGDDVAAAAALRRALEAAQGGTGGTASLHLALAKLYEHRLKDPERALEHARAAAPAEEPAASARRLTRLERRLLARGGLLG